MKILNNNFMYKFIYNYFEEFINLISDINKKNIIECVKAFKKINKNKIIFLGNGGSAAIASHVSVDLSKNAGIRSVNFNEADLITCLSNDYGHENWMQESLKLYCDKKDLVVLISSSGQSKNILNAARWCKRNKIKIITFSGNKKNNSLNKINDDGINFWINSKAYNYIECAHLLILMSITDLIIGKTIYKP